MLNGRAPRTRRILAVAGASALAITLSIQSASHAEPSTEEVEQRVGALYHEAERAQERLNEIRANLKSKQERLQSLQRNLNKQRAAVERMSDIVAQTIAEQAQRGAGFGTTGKLLVSENPDEVIDAMVAAEAFTAHQGAILTEFATESDQLELQESQVETEVDELAADKQRIATENATVEANLADAKQLLAQLRAKERERLRIEHQRQAAVDDATDPTRGAQRSSPAPAPAPATGRAAAAVEFALAQVGDAYVYGAAGPDAWDCSGLTMKAWAAAGVSLPHSSSMQMSSGTPVSMSQLQPGDLVAYYSPISHIGMYIGNGQLVHAANPSSPVEVVPVNSMPANGAVRPG